MKSNLTFTFIFKLTLLLVVLSYKITNTKKIYTAKKIFNPYHPKCFEKLKEYIRKTCLLEFQKNHILFNAPLFSNNIDDKTILIIRKNNSNIVIQAQLDTLTSFTPIQYFNILYKLIAITSMDYFFEEGLLYTSNQIIEQLKKEFIPGINSNLLIQYIQKETPLLKKIFYKDAEMQNLFNKINENKECTLNNENMYIRTNSPLTYNIALLNHLMNKAYTLFKDSDGQYQILKEDTILKADTLNLQENLKVFDINGDDITDMEFLDETKQYDILYPPKPISESPYQKQKSSKPMSNLTEKIDKRPLVFQDNLKFIQNEAKRELNNPQFKEKNLSQLTEKLQQRKKILEIIQKLKIVSLIKINTMSLLSSVVIATSTFYLNKTKIMSNQHTPSNTNTKKDESQLSSKVETEIVEFKPKVEIIEPKDDNND